jgi:hypothetical protein
VIRNCVYDYRFTIMFQNGQRVVCIDDSFEPWVFDLFSSLPKKNSIYTVRSVRPGRSNPNFVVDDDANLSISAAEFDILLLLEELINRNLGSARNVLHRCRRTWKRMRRWSLSGLGRKKRLTILARSRIEGVRFRDAKGPYRSISAPPASFLPSPIQLQLEQ